MGTGPRRCRRGRLAAGPKALATQSEPLIGPASTIRPNTASQWLRNGSCRVVTTNQNTQGCGLRENLGVAISPVLPGFPVPDGTRLDLIYFNENGERIGDSSIPVPGQHTASFPIPEQFQGKLVIVFCLQSPSTSFELDLTAIKVVEGDGFQFDNSIFADGFESGDTSSWSDQLP